jgi:Mn2+/Fe2+ NRAMP family transporter
VWLLVLASGTYFAVVGTRPLAAILFAQAANGLLLPVCAVFLLVVMNREILGEYRNRSWSNALGIAIVLFTVGLGALKLQQVLGIVS